MLKACPQCGDIRESIHKNDNCSRCRGTGHIYRMLTVSELSKSIEQNEQKGYRFVAIKRALIRDALLSAESL